MHADAYTHFLLSGGEGPFAPRSRAPELTDEEALQRLRADMQYAYRTARDPHIKLAMDYTRTLFSNSWHRLPTLIRALENLHQTGILVGDEGTWFEFRTTLGDTEAYRA